MKCFRCFRMVPGCQPLALARDMSPVAVQYDVCKFKMPSCHGVCLKD